ncbi:MAG: single-stranded DNA-binding protein [Saprospiraceae bacterium]|nr:single-stranded DNA-binding protein [Saprospiraceae bacterium]
MNDLRNTIQLIGHLGNDPEVKKLQNGKTLAKLSLATSEVYKNKNGERVQQTQWHQCIAWGKRAEVIENLLKKGKNVLVRGKLVYHNYTDRNGVMRYNSQIVVNNFVLLK